MDTQIEVLFYINQEEWIQKLLNVLGFLTGIDTKYTHVGVRVGDLVYELNMNGIGHYKYAALKRTKRKIGARIKLLANSCIVDNTLHYLCKFNVRVRLIDFFLRTLRVRTNQPWCTDLPLLLLGEDVANIGGGKLYEYILDYATAQAISIKNLGIDCNYSTMGDK